MQCNAVNQGPTSGTKWEPEACNDSVFRRNFRRSEAVVRVLKSLKRKMCLPRSALSIAADGESEPQVSATFPFEFQPPGLLEFKRMVGCGMHILFRRALFGKSRVQAGPEENHRQSVDGLALPAAFCQSALMLP